MSWTEVTTYIPTHLLKQDPITSNTKDSIAIAINKYLSATI